MKVIDAHVHVGTCQVLGAYSPWEPVLASMDKYGVDASLIQPHPWPKDPRAEHQTIANLAKQYPGRVYGMACINPYLDDSEYEDFFRWAIEDLDFRGIKIQTSPQAISPLHPATDKIFRLADEYKVPVMLHTGTGIPHALPSLVIPRAVEYPELPIVLAHSGANLFVQEAIVVAQTFRNVYLETSWVSGWDMMPMLKAVESDRIMLGSDVPENLPMEMCKFENLKMTEHDRIQIMGKTCATIYRIPYEE